MVKVVLANVLNVASGSRHVTAPYSTRGFVVKGYLQVSNVFMLHDDIFCVGIFYSIRSPPRCYKKSNVGLTKPFHVLCNDLRSGIIVFPKSRLMRWKELSTKVSLTVVKITTMPGIVVDTNKIIGLGGVIIKRVSVSAKYLGGERLDRLVAIDFVERSCRNCCRRWGECRSRSNRSSRRRGNRRRSNWSKFGKLTLWGRCFDGGWWRTCLENIVLIVWLVSRLPPFVRKVTFSYCGVFHWKFPVPIVRTAHSAYIRALLVGLLCHAYSNSNTRNQTDGNEQVEHRPPTHTTAIFL
mmetsp:Transcript_3341/g.6080  ORF Transcript_3341/g.6080 Transcript_3341/m.6080 type:complete len:295 (-) Transcript_3341:254-1138(-)